MSESQKWARILTKITRWENKLNSFLPGGILFGMFNVIMPILEQLEYGDFVIFSA